MADLQRLMRASHALDLAAVARLFCEAFDADGTLIFVVDPDDRELRVGAAQPPGGAAERALRIPVGYGVVGLVALNGSAVTLTDDSPRNSAHRQLLGLSGDETLSRMCVPARGLGHDVTAVIAVHRHREAVFTESDVESARGLADLMGLRLHAEQLRTTTAEHLTQRDQLMAQAISAQEAERRRIAGDLHDGVTQALVSLAFHLSAADAGLSKAQDSTPASTEAQLQVRDARRLAGLAYDETRAAISGLHSLLLDDLGLVAALESLTKRVPQLEIEFRADPVGSMAEVPEHSAAVLYRIAQEAINNAVRHADAQRAVLSIRRAGQSVVLGVTDDGVGFDVALARAGSAATSPHEHFGLSSILERCALIGATLRIDSVRGRGTAIIVELPLRRG